MEVRHEEEAKDADDDADELDFIVAGDAGSEEIIGNLPIKYDNRGAGG